MLDRDYGPWGAGTLVIPMCPLTRKRCARRGWGNKIAQAKCLLCEHEDPSSVPQKPH